MDRIEQKLAMHAQIVFLTQGRHNQFRGYPRRNMNGRRILHEIGDKPRDVLPTRKIRQRVGRQQLFVLFDNEIHLVDMEHSVSGNPGHLGIDLGDDDIGRLCRGQRDVHGHAEVHPAEIVGGSDLYEGVMDRDVPFGE